MEPYPDAAALYEYAACGLLVTTTDGMIRKVNTTFCRWLGYDADELVDRRRIQELFTMGGRFFHHTHWAPLLQMQGSVAEVLIDVVCRDRTILPTLINVIRRKYGDTSYDELAIVIATDRKQYERELLATRKTAETSLATLQTVQQELQESRDVLGIAMRGAKMGVWSRDLTSNHIWWSRELEELVGLGEGEFPGTQDALRNSLHEDDHELVRTAIDQAIASASDYVIEFRLRHANGQWCPMEGRGRASYNEAGQPQILFGVVIDISERRRVEEKLRQLNDQLSIADQRKDEFLATLAHELRNPLAPMRNVLEILKLKDFADPQLRWARDVIKRQVQQMTHLVDDLMEVSRITQGRLELRKQPLDLGEVIKHAIETSRELINASQHQFTVDIPDVPIILVADATRVMQVMSNLLTNAAKYTPRGGQIWLSLTQHENEVVLSVRDSGIGIPHEHLANVFEMFSQLTPALERSQGGLGIGLALVRGIIELHGGTITAESAGIGQGSEFIVRLPLPVAQTTINTIKDAALSTTNTGRRVLVVDDNIDAAESLAMALDLLGYQTRTANDGAHGLQQAEIFCPEVILLDIGLPDINGYEVARRIRAQRWGENIVLIAATGWGQERDKELAKAAGFDKHLTKPIDFYELDKMLKV